MARKPASDSIAGKVAAAAALDRDWEIPEGLTLKKAQMPVWRQYTQAKIAWKAIELRTIHRIVELETLYRELTGDEERVSEMLAVLKAIETQTRMVGLQGTTMDAKAVAKDGLLTQGRGKVPIKGNPKLSAVIG